MFFFSFIFLSANFLISRVFVASALDMIYKRSAFQLNAVYLRRLKPNIKPYFLLSNFNNSKQMEFQILHFYLHHTNLRYGCAAGVRLLFHKIEITLAYSRAIKIRICCHSQFLFYDDDTEAINFGFFSYGVSCMCAHLPRMNTSSKSLFFVYYLFANCSRSLSLGSARLISSDISSLYRGAYAFLFVSTTMN